MLSRSLFTICCFFILSINAYSQQEGQVQQRNSESSEQASIEVLGIKDPELKSYKTMLKGVQAFGELAGISPNATLNFRLISNSPEIDFKNVTLRLVSDTYSKGVPLSHEGFFVLDEGMAPLDEEVDLVLNVKKNSLRWRPDIRTPNLPENMRRLGDLRLECEVRWAIEKEDMSFLKRNGFRLLGGPCNSSRIAPIFISNRPIKSAKLISSLKEKELDLRVNGIFYTLPLHETDWSHDSLVEFDFK